MGELTVNGILATNDGWCWGSEGGCNETGENFHFLFVNDLSDKFLLRFHGVYMLNETDGTANHYFSLHRS